MVRHRPPRLGEYFDAFPLIFVTFNTRQRDPVLATPEVHAAFLHYCEGAAARGITVGRYVLMPDHVHLFVAGNFDLPQWVRGLRRAMAQAIGGQEVWQESFHDHVLRSGESYAEKWLYVRENPVRAGLVARSDEWPYQCEFRRIEWR